MRRHPRHARSLADERGFTLIELLVAMIMGIVVVSALFTIIDVTLHQTTRVFTQIDATQRARVAVAKIEHKLHSSCTGAMAPIQADSNPSSLSFVSAYSKAASVTPEKVTITFDAAAKTLTERVYPFTGTVSSPGFASLPSSTRTLLTKVVPSGATPVFQYFGFERPNDAAGNPAQSYMLLDGSNKLADGSDPVPSFQPLPMAGSPAQLGESNADRAAEVVITLRADAEGGSGLDPNIGAAALTVNDSVVLRLTPAGNHAGDSPPLPCE